MRESLEVSAQNVGPRDECEVVFKDQRGNPKVIVRDGGTGSFELNEDSRVVFRGLPAGQQHANSRLGEQFVEQSLVPALLRSTLKTGFDLPSANNGIQTSSDVPNCSARSTSPRNRSVMRFGQAQLSLPLVGIDLSLARYYLLESRVGRPLASHIVEIRAFPYTGRYGSQFLENDFVQAQLALCRLSAQGPINLLRNTANGVLNSG
jgi:hypothetical protein